MHPTNEDIVQGGAIVARLRCGAATWQKLESWKNQRTGAVGGRSPVQWELLAMALEAV